MEAQSTQLTPTMLVNVLFPDMGQPGSGVVEEPLPSLPWGLGGGPVPRSCVKEVRVAAGGVSLRTDPNHCVSPVFWPAGNVGNTWLSLRRNLGERGFGEKRADLCSSRGRGQHGGATVTVS